MLPTVRIVVQKYGGSSVADVARLRFVAQRAMQARRLGYGVVVVVSAMGDTTDELLAMAKQVSPNPDRRELDMLLSAGERISMALLSMAIRELGGRAISFTGSQSGIITDTRHVEARIIEVRPMRVQAELAKGQIVVVAGYQGVSTEREVTTLGRGGSDTTAVAMAAALKAEYCEICSDVDGVYTADPRVVPRARRIGHLSYEETQEMAIAGARVLNARAVEFARASGIAIYARATASPLPGADASLDGTVVSARAPHAPGVAVGVASESSVVVVDTTASRVDLERFWEARGVSDPGLFPPGASTRLVLSLENLHDEDRLAADLRAAFGDGTRLTRDSALVSVVGRNLGDAGRARGDEALSAIGVVPSGFVERPLRLVWLVPGATAADATRALHACFIEPVSPSEAAPQTAEQVAPPR